MRTIAALVVALATSLASLVARAEPESAKSLAAAFETRCASHTSDAIPTECDGLALATGRAFLREHHVAEALVSFRKMFGLRAGRAPTPAMTELGYEVARAYEELAIFDSALEWYERAAPIAPQSAFAPLALGRAAILAETLGEPARADAAFRDFVLRYGRTQPARTLDVAIVVASLRLQRDAAAGARAALSVLSSLETEHLAPVDLAIRAHALAARIDEREGTEDALGAARTERAAVLALWERHGPDIDPFVKIVWPDEDDAARLRRLGRTLTDVGEAYFYRAEARRLALRAKPSPRFRGAATARAVDAFYRSVVRPWAGERAEAIAAVEREYMQIANICPAPPPTWTVAASASVAAMWSDLADDFVAAAPRKGALPPRTQREMDALLDEAVQPWRDGRARPAAKTCLDLAAKLQVAGDGVTRCERWLAQHYPQSFHRDDVAPPALRTDEGLLQRAFGDAQPLTR